MERYKLILAYDGSGFAGSQRQAGRRTVQGELEKALRGLGWTGRSVLMAARTDAGVHAAGQVAAADVEWRHAPQAMRAALNSRLPTDLVVRDAASVAANFHPRFDATSRRYRYRIYAQPLRDPLRERLAWRVWPPPEAAGLRMVEALLLGTHDFGAFGSAPRRGASSVRTVNMAAWSQLGDESHFEIVADAFLYRMVRRLVFVQVAVAHGKYPPAAVGQALQTPQRPEALPAGLAPACGLTLLDVTY